MANSLMRPNRIIFLFISLLYSGWSFGQDLIVTNSGDSLNVEILRVQEDRITYLGEYSTKKLSINQNDVRSFQYLFYSENRRINFNFDPNNVKWRIGITGGLSKMHDTDVDPAQGDGVVIHFERLDRGWHVKSTLEYYFLGDLGVGLVFDNFLSKESTGVISDDLGRGTLYDFVSSKFIGTTAAYNINTNNESFTIFLSAGPGYTIFNQEFEWYDITGDVKAGAVGAHVSFGTDFSIGNNFMFGVEVSSTITTVKQHKLKFTDQPRTVINETTNLSTINLSLGFRWIHY